MTKVLHPAKFSDPILAVLAEKTAGLRPLLDPFAGTGRVHELGGDTWGVEIEPEWAAAHPRTLQADALALPWPDGTFACVATSCCYGNRLADHHTARDGSVRHSYTHDLRAMVGDPSRCLHPNNAGSLHWGPQYRAFHERAWAEVYRVLRPGGLFALNVSDHFARRERQPVAAWHRFTVQTFGFGLVDVVEIPTARLRYGANRERVEAEELQLFRKTDASEVVGQLSLLGGVL